MVKIISLSLVWLLVTASTWANASADFAAQVRQAHLEVLASQSKAFTAKTSQRFSIATLTTLSRGHNPKDCDDDNNGPSLSCIDLSCERMGRINCDDMHEIKAVTEFCRGANPRCMKAACDRLGKINCDDPHELKAVAQMCRGHYGTCVDEACNRLGKINCDDMHEIQRVTTACKGVDTGCIKSVCDRLGPINCDDLHEIEQVAKSCRGE